MRSSSFRVSEGRTLLCAKQLIALQGKSVVRLHLSTILDFRIQHSLSRFEVLLQTRTDEVLPALAADLVSKSTLNQEAKINLNSAREPAS